MLQKHRYEEEIKEKRSGTKSINMSTQIVENLLFRQISSLFELLDSDLDGMISANRIDITRLEARKLALLTPLLVEMEELNLELDKENFIEAVKRLSKNLSISEKDYLLGVETKKKARACTGSMNDCTFKVNNNQFFVKIDNWSF
jgi:hypothetical protein